MFTYIESKSSALKVIFPKWHIC